MWCAGRPGDRTDPQRIIDGRTVPAAAAPLVAGLPGCADLVAAVPVAAPPDVAFAVMTRWRDQHRWIPATQVEATSGDGRRVGDELSAWTGVGRFGVLDTMTIRSADDEWVVVQRTGRIVRGIGWMGVPRSDGDQTWLVWGAAVPVPFGAIGRAGWLVAGPLMRMGMRYALRRLARLVESGLAA